MHTESKELNKLIIETKERLRVLGALSNDLTSRLDDKELNDNQKLHACQFCFAITDAISVIINFNNKSPSVSLGKDIEKEDESKPSS